MKKEALILVALVATAALALVFVRPARQEADPTLPAPARPREVGAHAIVPPPAPQPGVAAEALAERTEVGDAPAVLARPDAPGSRHRLRGRVIDGANGNPIPGFRIEVQGTSLQAVSDAEGRFLFDLEAEEEVIVRVVPTLGWALPVDRYTVSAEFLRREEELVIGAQRVPMGAWSFLLVDQATDEPVPHFAMRVEGEDGATVALTSDEEGVVAVGGERLVGRRLSLRCRDHPLLSAQWERLPPFSMLPPMEGAPRPRLGIPVGPTYRLNVEGVGQDEFASLRATLSSQSAWRPADEAGSRVAPVRTEGGREPWVRFGPVDGYLGPGPPWLLEVSKAPDLSGVVAVQHVEGVHPGLLDVWLEGVGAIRGLAWNEDSNTPIVGADVALTADDGKPGRPPDRSMLTAEDGTFHFPRLRPGSYSVRLQAMGYPSESLTLAVLLGETTEHEFRLSTDVLFGQVSGTLTSATGRFSMPISLVLTPRKGVGSVQLFTWEERDKSMVAPFAFKDLPHGEYRLSLVPSGGYLWEPREMDVTSPAEGLAFLCRDDLQPINVHIRAFDASTQEELSEMWVFIETRVEGAFFALGDMGPIPSGAHVGFVIPGRTTLDWVVGAPGFAPVRGDETSLAEISKPWGPVLEAEVHLEPGWGILLDVLESQPDGQDSPFEGAIVHADGELLGKTGRDGRLLLSRPRAPERIEVSTTPPRYSWAEFLDDEGRLLPKFRVRGRVWMH